MGVALAQVIWQRTTGLPEDRCVNTLHAQNNAGAWTSGQAEDFADAVVGFFNNPTPPNRSLSAYLSTEIDDATDAHEVRIYDLLDTPPRVPVFSRSFNRDLAGSSSAMPSEVAACLSFRSALVSGANMARRRNRIFLGPLCASAVTPISTPPVYLDDAISEDFFASGQDFADELSGAGLTWVTYSPSDAASHVVASMWVDNAPDTQRRRGVASNQRWTEAIV